MKIIHADINGIRVRLRWDAHWDYWYLSRKNARAVCGGRFNQTYIFVVAGVPCRCARVIVGGKGLHRIEVICAHSRTTLTRALLSTEPTVYICSTCGKKLTDDQRLVCEAPDCDASLCEDCAILVTIGEPVDDVQVRCHVCAEK